MSFHGFIVAVVCGRRALFVLAALGLCSCAVVGPESITAGRGVYSEVITRTDDEQILNAIVRLRYDESFGMMSVASVTANLSFSARAGANIGVGDSDNYAGNLVPLSAGIAYEENPTISYVPLSGEEFMRRMVSPVPLNQWLLLGRLSKHPGHMLDLASTRVNGLRNPLLGKEPPSPEFARLVKLYDQLRRVGVIDVVQPSDVESHGNYAWYIHGYGNTHSDGVRELLDLLGIKVKPDGSPILVPVRVAVSPSATDAHVQTRSAYDVLQVFGAGIELPQAHLQAGLVEEVIWAVPKERRIITIRTSEKRPDDAVVAIFFRDRWFYVDSTDTKSKRAFSFLRTFIGMRLADPGASQQGPVLTVPTS